MQKRNFTGDTENFLRSLYKNPGNLNLCTRKNSHDEYYGNFSCGITCMESKYFSNKSGKTGLKTFLFLYTPVEGF